MDEFYNKKGKHKDTKYYYGKSSESKYRLTLLLSLIWNENKCNNKWLIFLLGFWRGGGIAESLQRSMPDYLAHWLTLLNFRTYTYHLWRGNPIASYCFANSSLKSKPWLTGLVCQKETREPFFFREECHFTWHRGRRSEKQRHSSL